MGIADYLSRHPSENKSDEYKVKVEELCTDWFTVNEVTKTNEVVSEKQQPQATLNQPIRAKLANENKLRGSEEAASESELLQINKQSFKQIATITPKSPVSTAKSDANDSDVMSDEIIHAAEQPLIESPVC